MGNENRAMPSPEDIRAVAELFDPKAFEPHIKRATDEIYGLILAGCEDYLRDNIEFNIGSHIAMLERENQRMRAELFEVDKALGCMSLGQEARLVAIKETLGRYNHATSEMWRLREALAQAAPTPSPRDQS